MCDCKTDLSVPKHILVVDDEENTRLGLQLLLQSEGHRVCTAADGLCALALLQSDSVDLVLTDLQMPHLDGLGLLQAVRRDFPHVHVILMTAMGNAQKRAAIASENGCPWVDKPVQIEDLRLIMRQLPVAWTGE